MVLPRGRLLKIVKQLFNSVSEKKLKLTKPQLIQTLDRIDDLGRPLYAYLLAQQLVESEEGLKKWTKIDLLQFQLERDKLRWEQAFKKDEAPTWGDEHLAIKLAVLATIVDELKFDDPIIKNYFGTIDSRVRKEAASVTTGFILNKNERPRKIFALKPPLLGGWFVLTCFNQGLTFGELLNIAWKYSPDKTATFLHRITQDFASILPVTLLPVGNNEKFN